MYKSQCWLPIIIIWSHLQIFWDNCVICYGMSLFWWLASWLLQFGCHHYCNRMIKDFKRGHKRAYLPPMSHVVNSWIVLTYLQLLTLTSTSLMIFSYLWISLVCLVIFGLLVCHLLSPWCNLMFLVFDRLIPCGWGTRFNKIKVSVSELL